VSGGTDVYRPGSGTRSDVDLSLALYPRSLEKRGRVLDAEQERAVARQAKSGCPVSRREFIERNLRLVVYVARQYRGVSPHLRFQDLIQEGNVGLLAAVERFDPEAGYRFFTYAIWWIKEKILRALSKQGRTLRLPAHVQADWRSVQKARTALELRTGEPVDPALIADELVWPADKVLQCVALPPDALSLNMPARGARGHSTAQLPNNRELSDLVPDGPQEASPEEISIAGMGHQELAAELRRRLLVLNHRERRVVELRYGLAGRETASYAEIAVELDVSRERARQIHNQAMALLKQSYGLTPNSGAPHNGPAGPESLRPPEKDRKGTGTAAGSPRLRRGHLGGGAAVLDARRPG
jgi:RNA polymerase primary sigma factor